MSRELQLLTIIENLILTDNTTGVAKLLTKSNSNQTYKVCAEYKGGSDHLNNISDSYIFLNTIKQIKKLHTLFYEKLDEYYFLKRVDPGNPECEDLRLDCIRLGEESEKLVDSLFQV